MFDTIGLISLKTTQQHDYQKIFLQKPALKPSYAELFYLRQEDIINRTLQKLKTNNSSVIPAQKLVGHSVVEQQKSQQIIGNGLKAKHFSFKKIKTQQKSLKSEEPEQQIEITPRRTQKFKKVKDKLVQDRFKDIMNYDMENFSQKLHKELIGSNRDRQNDKRHTYLRLDLLIK